MRIQSLCAGIPIGAITVCAAGMALVQAQPTYPGCSNFTASDFTKTELFNRTGGNSALATDNALSEPVQMDLHGVYAAGKLDHVDVFFVERLGNVKRYDGATQKVTTLGKIDVWGRDDNGLMGIALDPQFDQNRKIYLWYAPKIASATMNRHLILGRFTLKTDFTLDMDSEEKMIDILASKTDKWHSGGPMTFDQYGDLWITIGNNSFDLSNNSNPANGPVFTHYSTTDSSLSAEWGSSNTASMRGGVIRIHPEATGYSIPAGNFGEYWAAEFARQGNDSLAAQYRDPIKVLPEVYIKGTRSNFSIAVHPTKRWVAWGEVNYASNNDEFNIVTHPAFTGFPYFHGNNTRIFGQQETMGFLQDAAKPRNVSSLNSGVTDLPPATAAAVTNLVNVAIGGPIYVFDPSLDSKTKFPPHLHNTWLAFGYSSANYWLFQIDSNQVTLGPAIQVSSTIFSSAKVRKPVAAKYGPDGALYILNYDATGDYGSPINPGVMRVDYVGDCILPVTDISGRGKRSLKSVAVLVRGNRLQVDEAGSHTLEILDLQGKPVLTLQGKQGAIYSLADLATEMHLGKGLFIARVHAKGGTFERTISLL